MNRLALALLLLATSSAAFALDAATPPAGARIGILAMAERYANGSERGVAETVRRDLQAELRTAGYDAFDANATYDTLGRNAVGNADYYIDIVSSEAQGQPVGDVDLETKNVGVAMTAVVSHVAAELRLYDGHTLELVRTYDLSRRKTTVRPTAINLRNRYINVWLPLPWVGRTQARAAAHEVAVAAAAHIVGGDEKADRD